MSTIGGSPYASSLFSALSFSQADLLASAAGIPQFALPTLMNAYQSVTDQSPLMANAFIPPFLQMPSPAAMFAMMQPIAGAGYAGSTGPSRYSPDRWVTNFFDPTHREAARFERVLRGDPFARTAFEQAVGGRIVDFGDRNDGRMLIQPQGFNPYAQVLAGAGLSPIANQLGNLYQQMNQGVLGAPQFAGPGSPILSPFLPMALNAFAGMASQLMGAGGMPPMMAPGGGRGFDGFQGGVQGMPLFGTSQGSWNPLAQPGKIQGSNAAREGNHSAQISSILNDPSLTMEDKIMLALMVICQKMDDDIKRQTEYLNQLQNQQGARKGKGGGKAGGGEKSIDLETKKLERMIQKRSQLFDTLSKIMERYDQSAKNVIQSMRG